MEYAEFFGIATGAQGGGGPYDYQRRIAEGGLPDVIEVPTGAGKTFAAVGSWLYRRFYADAATRRATPRRLVYALPMRVLVESVTDEVIAMRDRLGLTADITVVHLMGGTLASDALTEWRVAMETPSVVIGTVDQIVSRQLMRGYGASRRTYPIDFALVTNGAHVVVDEIQLAGQATSTARQIASFQRRYGTSEPTGLTCMSATIEPSYLDTVDNPYSRASADVVRLSERDRTGPLATRLAATRRIRQLHTAAKDSDVAAVAAAEHRAGTLTLVVVNRVDEAIGIHQALAKRRPAGDAPDILLVHSRFRGRERRHLNDRLRSLTGRQGQDALADTPGVIVVATQAVEAGIDLDAATLITEVAPWPSLCQRVGRCNRSGAFGAGEKTTATVLWFDRGKPEPYAAGDVAAAVDALTALDERCVTSESLLAAGPPSTPDDLSILRAPTFQQLFDTAPDLSGGDIDVRRYIRSDDDSDVQVAWVDAADIAEGLRGRPPTPWRVAVSLAALRLFLKRKDTPRAWVFDQFGERWVRVHGGTRLQGQDLVLIDREDGGYDTTIGFDPSLTGRVAPIHTDADPDVSAEHEATDSAAEDVAAEPGSLVREWELLADHLAAVRDEAVHLMGNLTEGADLLTAEVEAAVAVAAYTHDVGKAFPGWQRALRAVGTRQDGTRVIGPVPPEGLLAKGPRARDGAAASEPTPEQAVRRRLDVRMNAHDADGNVLRAAASRREGELRRQAFRHELVSLLYLGSAQGRSLLTRLGVPETRHALVHYLVAAHHGVLRMSLRDPVKDGRDGLTVLGVVPGEELPAIAVGELCFDATTADLSMFAGGGDSWGSATADLLAEFGPFRLAYLETVLRMADWRASGALPVTSRSV